MFEKIKAFLGVKATKSISPQEKKAALIRAVQLWSDGRYEPATELCKRYGITNEEFARYKLAYSRALPSSVTTQEKEEAARKALYLWQRGEYQKAVKLYKSYGISDRDFSRYMVAGMRQEK